MSPDEISAPPSEGIAADWAHLCLRVPDALKALAAWGFEYKSNLIRHKVRKDGGSDSCGVGFFFRNVTELCLFVVRDASAGAAAGEPAGRAEAGAQSQAG